MDFTHRSDSTLKECFALADGVEEALRALGDLSNWPAWDGLRARCDEFRRECGDLAEQNELDHLAIAFIGPKNAGKTTMLSLLVRSPEVVARLNPGVSIDAATEKITWIGPRAPRSLDRAVEQAWRVGPTELVNLGATYTLIDVPGSNELHRSRSEAARRALRAAHLKVLVVEARCLEDASILDYVSSAAGACVLPVINQIRPGVVQRDVDVFLARLKNALPGGTVLPPIQLRDLELEPAEEAERLRQTAAGELRDRLAQTIKARRLDELVEPQLAGLRSRFQAQMREELARELPATARAVEELQAAEKGLAVEALEGLLGAREDERAVLIGLRQQLRGIYQQRTSVLFFPWRTFVSLANLLHGALEKVPLLLVGSVPSLLSSAFTAVKNVVRDREFHGSRDNGLRQRAELLVREKLQPRVAGLEAAIRGDLRGHERVTGAADLEVRFEGLDLLQQRSSRLFNDALERHAVSRLGAALTGLLGMTIFWVIFAWPMVALYKDYFDAIHHLLSGQEHHFPAHALPTLATSFLLAVLPMLFLLLLVLAWAAHAGRARSCLADLRSSHLQAIQELGQNNLLRIRADHPRLTACLRLFDPGKSRRES